MATKNHSANFNLYGKLKDFHETLQRSAVRQFSDKVKSDATCVALKGYALVSLIAERGFVLKCASDLPAIYPLYYIPGLLLFSKPVLAHDAPSQVHRHNYTGLH